MKSLRLLLVLVALFCSLGASAEAQFIFDSMKPRTGGLADPPKPAKVPPATESTAQTAGADAGGNDSAGGALPPPAQPEAPTAQPAASPTAASSKSDEPPLPAAAARDAVNVGGRSPSASLPQAAPPMVPPPRGMEPGGAARPVQVIAPGKPPAMVKPSEPGNPVSSASSGPIRLRLGSGVAGFSEAVDVVKETLAVPLNKTSQIRLGQPIRDIVVGNPEVADVVVRSADQIFVHGKNVGETNLFMLDVNGNVARRIEVSVMLDVESLRQMLTQLLPNEALEVSSVGENIVLSGNVRSDGAAGQARSVARRYVKKEENIVSLIKVRTEQQVLIQVRVAEVQKAVLKELGISNTLSDVGMATVFAEQGVISATTTAIGLGTDIAGQFNMRGVVHNLSSVFRVLEKQGLVKNLAEPNLLAVSGELANMLAGGEYPIPVPDKDGIKIEYKPFGVGLSFLPVVLDTGRISLKLATEVSALSATNDVQIPVTGGSVRVKSFTVRRANSTVELPSGGSVMIAGLLQNDVVSSLNGLPGLMDLPILGPLFRSSSFQRQETELVILVSALLVRPSDPKSLSLPTDGHVVSSDFDRYFLGKIQETYVKRPLDGRAASGPQGSIGYIVD